jgi:hypothetical protein
VSDAVYYTIIVFAAAQRRKNGRKAGDAPSGVTVALNAMRYIIDRQSLGA